MSIHPTAIIESGAKLGAECVVWHFCHVRSGAELGALTSLGRDVYVDKNVKIGRGSRVQNGVSIYEGVNIGEWCFVGPHVTFTNDPHPRAGRREWKRVQTHLHSGSSLGAGAILCCGITIGAFAMVGAGAVVTKDVEPFTVVTGIPAAPVGKICACGDTSLPLDAVPSALLRDCCRKNLAAEPLALATAIIAGS